MLPSTADLSHIDYRIGTYSDFREVLARNLNKDAVLSAWTHRGIDDPGIALLEGASILGDILTFYQELYANEAYLRTAQWRESIADLVRLLGYCLSPGVGGKATFAFEVKGDKHVHSFYSHECFNFTTVQPLHQANNFPGWSFYLKSD